METTMQTWWALRKNLISRPYAPDGDVEPSQVQVVFYADAQATVEALQRERDELKELTNVICGHCCEPMAIPSRAVLQAALDAERERYELLNVERNAIDDKRHVLHEQLANTIEAAAQQEGELAEIQALAANLESYLSQLQALVRVAKAEVWREAAVKYALWVGEDSEVPADPHLDGYERFEDYCHDRAALDATTPAPRQRQVHSCEIPGCVSCANPEEGGDGE